MSSQYDCRATERSKQQLKGYRISQSGVRHHIYQDLMEGSRSEIVSGLLGVCQPSRQENKITGLSWSKR